MALYSRIAERGVFVTAEGENSLAHLLGVEHLKPHEQVEVLHRQTGDGREQFRFELGNHVLEGVLAEVGQVHERRNACLVSTFFNLLQMAMMRDLANISSILQMMYLMIIWKL